MFLFRGSKSSALESLESKRRLAILRKDVARIVKHLMENAKSYHHLTLIEICRLKIRFNAKNVFEFEPSIWNGYDAYSYSPHCIIQNRMMHCIQNMAKPPNLRLIRPIFAARCIQRWWRQCITNPQYKICKKRLFQEWSELTSPLY